MKVQILLYAAFSVQCLCKQNFHPSCIPHLSTLARWSVEAQQLALRALQNINSALDLENDDQLEADTLYGFFGIGFGTREDLLETITPIVKGLTL
jgi:hypothetical protein